MKMPSILRDPIADFYVAARAACKEIERQECDLLLVASPAGHSVALAAEAVWRETRQTPFPPLVLVDISMRHVGEFSSVVNPQYGALYLRGADLRTAAPYMAWVKGRATWQAQLREAIERVLGAASPPNSVLVLGDQDVFGTVAPLALGLLAAVFPAARAMYLPYVLFFDQFPPLWVIPFLDLWLSGMLPGESKRLPAYNSEEWVQVSTDLVYVALNQAATDELGIGVQSVGPDDAAVARLSAYFRRTRVLGLARWAAESLQRHVVMRHRRQVWPARRRHAKPLPTRRFDRYSLPPEFKIAGELWARRRLTVGEAAGVSGLSSQEAAALLQAATKPGLLEAAAGPQAQALDERAYVVRNEVGILAYGSLRLDPGPELEAWTESRIEGVETPFPVEFVRSSPTRCGAPVLVPVPVGYGASVPADILLLAPGIDAESATKALLKRKLDRIDDDGLRVIADEEEMPVNTIPDFAGVPVVLYAAGRPNLPEVIPDDVSLDEKGTFLARLAVASMAPETYEQGHDGIQYLADAIGQGIATPLTGAYCQAVLHLAGGAPDLQASRQRIAAQLGLGEGEPQRES